MKAMPTRYIVKQQKLFNSRRADFSPVLDSEGRLYFTTTNEKVTGTSRSEVTGTKRCDIWVADKDEQGRWQRPLPAEGALNTEADEGVIAFSPDGRTMYLTRASKNPQADSPAMICTSTRSEASERSASDRSDSRYCLQLWPSCHRSVGALYLLRVGPARQHRADRHLAHRTQQRVGRPRKSRHGDKHTGKRDVSGDAHRQPYVFFVRRTPGMGGLDLFMARLQPSGCGAYATWECRSTPKPMTSA